MKKDAIPAAATLATLKDVIDRVMANPSLTETRKRDLRSGVVSFGKLTDRSPALIALDLAAIREVLDATVPAQAKISRKRFTNLRSDLGSAIEASGLRPMIRTVGVDPNESWTRLLGSTTKKRICYGLSRFSRWASMRRIAPRDVDATIIDRFVAELETASLTRDIRRLHRTVIASWNQLVRLRPNEKLHFVETRTNEAAPKRVPWSNMPASFRSDVDKCLAWAAMADPLDEMARERGLAPRTLNLRRDHIHSAVTAAVRSGIELRELTSLADLVDVERFRKLLRQRREESGSTFTAYTHGLAGTLISIAAEWVKAPSKTLETLKSLRRKLGPEPSGLTEKNKTFLRQFEDPRLLEALIQLPNRLWRIAQRDLAKSRRPFIDLQNAIAIDLLLHLPLRMENLAGLNFPQHLYWPQGRGKPALVVIKGAETKNRVPLEFEIPATLADRLLVYRNEIAPRITGTRPDALFITWTGTPRTKATIALAIEKCVLRNLGVKLTPHQFRHLAAKIILDVNPGAYELVRQLLGHRNITTTTSFYAGIDTRRAGRAHGDIIKKLRENGIDGRRKSRRPSQDLERD